jgi:FkbM family methyltransferase
MRRLLKPWFVHRPSQVLRRALAAIAPPPAGFRPLMTAWGVAVTADPAKTNGRSILTTGVYDIAVSELLARLIRPGDTVVDAGANVGYMTLLAAVMAGSSGHVFSFEPHPTLFQVLESNLAAAVRTGRPIARTTLVNAALGDSRGTAILVTPSGFDVNDGLARLGEPDAGEQGAPVSVETLDDFFVGQLIAVCKIDVEGSEIAVLRGARRLLQLGSIAHIVFEEHRIQASETVRFLQSLGYEVFSLGWQMNRLALAPVKAGRLAHDYEAPNFVASIRSDELLERCSERGWKVLDRRLGMQDQPPALS